MNSHHPPLPHPVPPHPSSSTHHPLAYPPPSPVEPPGTPAVLAQSRIHADGIVRPTSAAALPQHQQHPHRSARLSLLSALLPLVLIGGLLLLWLILPAATSSDTSGPLAAVLLVAPLIVGLIVLLLYVPAALVAISLGLVALGQARREPSFTGDRRIAMLGLALGVGALVVLILGVCSYVLVFVMQLGTTN